MTAATLYDLVRVLHISADIVFIAGLLAGMLALAALSFQAAPAMAKERGRIAAMRGFNRVVTGPALVILWSCGLWLAWRAGWFASGWVDVQLLLGVALGALDRGGSSGLRRRV